MRCRSSLKSVVPGATTKLIEGLRPPYTTNYELNLVLEDGKRINVVDHENQDSLREDAGTLAAFLDKPIWDAT